jgi:hypothetical protein
LKIEASAYPKGSDGKFNSPKASKPKQNAFIERLNRSFSEEVFDANLLVIFPLVKGCRR